MYGSHHARRRTKNGLVTKSVTQKLLQYANYETRQTAVGHTNLEIHITWTIHVVRSGEKLIARTQNSENIVQNERTVILTAAADVSHNDAKSSLIPLLLHNNEHTAIRYWRNNSSVLTHHDLPNVTNDSSRHGQQCHDPDYAIHGEQFPQP